MDTPSFETKSKIIQKAGKTIKKKMFSYIATGFGLIAGLAWNDAVKTLIDYFIPAAGATIIAKLAYAFIITIVVGVVLFYVEKSLEEDSG